MLHLPLGPVILDVAGVRLDAIDRERLCHRLVGGVILFARNIREPTQVAALCREIRALREPTLLITVDQEGGRVQRLREGFTELPPMARLGELYDKEPEAALSAARALGLIIGLEVAAVGIDLSFAPVLDLDFGRSQVIGDRAFHSTPEVVGQLGAALCVGLGSAGVQAVGKHFPGHGHAREDSHHRMAVDPRPLADLEADISPYGPVIAAGLAGVMPAHVVYPQVDAQPAGFSGVWLREILRTRLGFQGAIFSDDLSMEGAARPGGVVESARAALEAGCDCVLVCNRPDLADRLLARSGLNAAPAVSDKLAAMHARAPFAPPGAHPAYAPAVALLRGRGLIPSDAGPTA